MNITYGRLLTNLGMHDKFRAILTIRIRRIVHNAMRIIRNIIGLAIVAFVISMFESVSNIVEINPNVVIPIGSLLFMPKSKSMYKLMSHYKSRCAISTTSPIWTKIDNVFSTSETVKSMAIDIFVIFD